ncbi:MAG TPA: DUF6093 family protein [Nocardioidaceae bacterium]|nr:DUF6093 family protein [Nocardioidaceae bacterium]
MSATTAALRGQSAAERLMTDTCTITRPDPDTPPVFDDATGTYTTPTVTVYEGKCRVRPTNVDRTVEAGDVRVHLWHSVISVPISVSGVQVNDTVTITASTDPGLVGKVYTVGNIDLGTAITARRLGCNLASS